MPIDPIETLCELIAIASVNPMGRPVSGAIYYETRLTDYLEDFFQRLALATLRQTIEPGRDNLLARLEGQLAAGAGGPLMLEVHQDTVPVDGMTIDPFRPEVRDGRVYGRGACDVKGGMAAILSAVARLSELPPSRRPTIVVACTINEEYGFTGAAGLVRGLRSELAAFLPEPPSACVVAEPTSLSAVVAHRGTVRWKCLTTGRAAHSSEPQRGENAIYRMARVVAALERYAREIVPTLASDPLCGRPTLSVGTIAGGTSVNTVPFRATIEVDRRTVPGEDPLTAWRHVRQYLASAEGIDFPVLHDEPYMIVGGLSDRHNGAICERLVAAGAGQAIGVAYGTDASTYAAAGIPSVVFGPGSIQQAHTADEWIECDQVVAASEILFRLAVGSR